MERMLGLARDMGVVLPEYDEDIQMSRWAARCLQAHDNLQRWSQMAVWTGDPSHDGEPKAWSPSKVVVVPAGDASSMGDIAAAVPPWNRRQGDAARHRWSWSHVTTGTGGRRGHPWPVSAAASRGTLRGNAWITLRHRPLLRRLLPLQRLNLNPNRQVGTHQTPGPFNNLRHLMIRGSHVLSITHTLAPGTRVRLRGGGLARGHSGRNWRIASSWRLSSWTRVPRLPLFRTLYFNCCRFRLIKYDLLMLVYWRIVEAWASLVRWMPASQLAKWLCLGLS